jgi:hypothetical protein
MLKINFLPYAEIENLGTYQRIKKILNIVRDKRRIILEGRLKREEETELIKVTMEEIDKSFKGIELAVIYPGEGLEDNTLSKIRSGVAGVLLGDRQGMTIIGPASVVKEIKKDPNNIELLTTNGNSQKKLSGRGAKKQIKKSRR